MLSSIKILWLIFAALMIFVLMMLNSLWNVEGMQKKILSKVSSPMLIQQTAGTKTYWLSAKNPESEYMKHVREVFHHLGYKRWDGKTGDWNVMWSYEYPFGKISANTLTYDKKVNHFPGSGYITSKVYLATSKSRYIPKAFSLPFDKNEFLEFAKANPDKLWVQKNNNHRGIVIKPLNELDLKAQDSFVQEYVSNPFLVDGRKFDIGLYTVITSIEPLVIYVLNSEWLIRYCPVDYHPFDARDPGKYVVADEYTGTWEMPSLKKTYTDHAFSHKQTLMKYLHDNGRDGEKLQADMYQAIVDVLVEKQDVMLKAMKKYPYSRSNFFELVRYDFVFDDDMNVYLMEVNMSPNLSSGHFAQNALTYRQVLFSTLTLVGVAHSTVQTFNNMPLGDREMIFSRRNIVAFPELCTKCETCATKECLLCEKCMSQTHYEILHKVQLEHLRKGNFMRVYPKPLLTQENAVNSHPLRDNSIPNQADKLLAFWFKGKCQQDPYWCV